MDVDVTTEIVIDRPRTEVAPYASDPDHATEWCATTYEFTDAGAEATRMTLRNAGTPGGFAKIAARGTERAMRSANKKDLQRLKELLEASPSRR
jgi:hypothetical protein